MQISTGLFQSQMGMAGNPSAYREFRASICVANVKAVLTQLPFQKTLKEIIDECLDAARTAGSQTPESWAAFKSEVARPLLCLFFKIDLFVAATPLSSISQDQGRR